MALQDKSKFSLIQLFISANTRVENVAKSDDFRHDPVLMHLRHALPYLALPSLHWPSFCGFWNCYFYIPLFFLENVYIYTCCN